MHLSAFRIASLASALMLAGCADVVREPAAVDPRVERAIQAVRLDPAAALAAVNVYRQARGVGAVRLDPDLTAMAQHQAEEMAAKGAFSHTVGGLFTARLAQAKIQAREAGENLGAGYYSLGEAMSGWKGSAEHNANLLRPGFTRIGVAIAKNAKTEWGVYWAMEFAGEPGADLTDASLLVPGDGATLLK